LDFTGTPGISPSQVTTSITAQSGYAGVNGNINANPQFVSANSDFHLQSGSPARHAGTVAGAPAVDLDCQPRGSPPSIGAYEFDGPNMCPSTYSAPLTATPTSGTPPLAVTFTASGLTLPMTYSVNFGDGTTGALTQSSCIGLAAIVGGQGGIQCSGSASHTYTAAGSYTATLLNALGLTVGTLEIFVTGAAPNISVAAPHRATAVGSQAILGSQTIPAMQDVPRQTVEIPFAGSNATVPTISSFTASPASISPFAGGGSATLSWTVASATSISISGLGAVIGNSIQVSPSKTTTYTLTASNAQGSMTAQTTVTVAGYRWQRADPLSR
jgi:PKD repeat protein